MSRNYGFYEDRFPKKLVCEIYKDCERISDKSPDNVAKIGAAVLGSINGRAASSIAFNGIPEGMMVPLSLWDKKDYDIGNGVLLNKRDIVLHAEERAVLAAASFSTRDIGIVTSFPCPRCLMYMYESGIRTVVYGDTQLNNMNAKRAKTLYMAKNAIQHIEFIDIKDLMK